LNARIPLTTRNIIPSLAVGGNLTGTIPRCSFLEKVGYVDNVMAYKPYFLEIDEPEYYKELLAQRDQPLPPLNVEPTSITSLCAWNDLPSKEVSTKAGTVKLRSVQSIDEVIEVEKLIRSSAEKGIGFGIDEFNAYGHFNRKFVPSPDILVAESTDGEIVGASLLGPSGLSRSEKPTLCHIYITVKDTHANMHLGSALFRHSMDVLKPQGYSTVITDAYMNNFPMLQILRREKFFASGCMPYCAYLKNHGALDSLLFYKIF
jgi:GNAT superfamily N-acetyltransferase